MSETEMAGVMRVEVERRIPLGGTESRWFAMVMIGDEQVLEFEVEAGFGRTLNEDTAQRHAEDRMAAVLYKMFRAFGLEGE